MNNSKGLKVFFIACVTILVGFAGGFYFGNGSFELNQYTQASESLDMRPFWKVFNTLQEKHVSPNSSEKIDETELLYGAISGMVDAFGDSYTVFFTPEEKKQFNESIEGVFEGVGMEIGMQDSSLVVVAPLKGSPAERSGVEKGDIIVSVDGVDAYGMKIEEAVALIRGPKGTDVVLHVLKKDSTQPIKITITRDTINVPTLDTEIIDDVFIISFYSFGNTATREFKTAMNQFSRSGLDKLILDMRGNPGGYLDASVDIAGLFLPNGKAIVIEDFGPNTNQKILRSKGGTIWNTNNNMVVLIDEGSASASEIVAGALQEHGIAQLVGTQSFGKGSVQQLIDITSETALKFTIAQWLTPNGKSISDGGLTPDIEVEFDSQLYKEKQIDTQLQKALELLQ